MALVEEHDRKAFDVVHGFWADGGGVVAALAQIKLNIPTVVTVMAGELTFEAGCNYGKRIRPVGGRVARYGASRADTLLSLSNYHQQAIAAQNPQLFPGRMTCGVNISRFKPAGNAQMLDGEIPILFVGSQVDVKGVDLLIRACTRAADRVAGLHLHIVGCGEKSASLQSLANDRDAPVTFHGHIDHSDLPGYYRSARFCVLGSWFESYAMVVAEAAACGRVTVGTDVGCMAVFCPKKYLCSAGDVAGIANVMVAAASEERLRPLASPASVQQMTNQLVDLYATMASAH
jgi:glycosyltransferase involved in cell wall biosynthesis